MHYAYSTEPICKGEGVHHQIFENATNFHSLKPHQTKIFAKSQFTPDY